jgi:hypothetical protein
LLPDPDALRSVDRNGEAVMAIAQVGWRHSHYDPRNRRQAEHV